MAGSTAAFLLKKRGFQVTVLEGDGHAGGGVWTRYYAGHPHTFGPRIFFSKDEQVIELLTSLIEIREFFTRAWTFVEEDQQLYHYPLQYADLPTMPDYDQVREELDEREGKTPSTDDFEAYWQSAIGPTLYGKFVRDYSKKMWGIESNRQLTANWDWVNRGTPIRDGDDRLYTDQFQGYPRDPRGYNGYFERALEGCDARYGCRVQRFDPDRGVVHSDQGELTADVIINSVHVDALFGFEFGRLQYSGRQFIPLWLPVEHALPEDVTWIHYSGKEEHTRVTEFKKITGYKSESTLLGLEVPSNRGRYYPVQTPPEVTRYQEYTKLFPRNFSSIGRLGTFQYKGIPDAIRDAIDAVDELTS